MSSNQTNPKIIEAVKNIGIYMIGAFVESMSGRRPAEGWEDKAAEEAADQFLQPLVEDLKQDNA